MRLIDADNLSRFIADFKYNKQGRYTDEQMAVLDLVEAIIENQPTVFSDADYTRGYIQGASDERASKSEMKS